MKLSLTQPGAGESSAKAKAARKKREADSASPDARAAQDPALDQDRNKEDVGTTIAITCLYSDDVTDQSGWRRFSGGSLSHALAALHATYGVEFTNPVVLLDGDGEIDREIKVFSIQTPGLGGGTDFPEAPLAQPGASLGRQAAVRSVAPSTRQARPGRLR